MSRIHKIVVFILAMLPAFTANAIDKAYGAYGLYITGSTRVLAMGGAFVGLADDATSVISNPAGLALSRWTFDLQGTSNRVINREGDIDSDGTNDGLPYNFLYSAAALSIGPFGLGAGYSVPYKTEDNFGGLSTSKQKILIESLDVALALKITKSIAIGATLHKEKATISFEDSSNSDMAEDTSEFTYPSLGLIFRPEKKWGFGITYSPERRYDIDDNINSTLISTFNWFQDLVIPAKLNLGFSLQLKKSLTLVGDMDIYYPTEETYLIGSNSLAENHKFIEKQYTLWHGGFEFSVVNKKILNLFGVVVATKNLKG